MSPVVRVLHYNPKGTKGYTICGRLLAKVKWTESMEDTTCNACIRAIERVAAIGS